MYNIMTKYGELKGISALSYFDNDNQINECIIEEYCELHTSYGILVPSFSMEDSRKRHRNSIVFYPTGNLKSIYLENQTAIRTAIGVIKAELITFYEDGNIHRIFPRYGQITGYWTEKNEYEIAEIFDNELNGIKILNKVLSFCFYNSGVVKSITLWQGEHVLVETIYGIIKTRIGISFYESGKVKSIEPCVGASIETELETCHVYQINPLGIHGDLNSLEFYEDGSLKSFKTVKEQLLIQKSDGGTKKIAPQTKPSLINPDTFEILPIQLNFEGAILNVLDADGNKHFIHRNETTCTLINL